MLQIILLTLVLIIPVIIKLLLFIYRQFLRPPKNLKKLGGSWVVVTGSTDGIGKAYAFELAKKGLHICLVSIFEGECKTTCEEIQKQFSEIQTYYFAVDLTAPTQQNWDDITQFFKSNDVGILVNNAGMAYEHVEYLHLLDPKFITNIIAINTTSVTQLCRIALETMVERNKGGCIVNIASGAACLSTVPLAEVYAATKAYVQNFSKSLADAYKDKGIIVQVVNPWFVATKMLKMTHLSHFQASFMVPSPKTFVKAAINHIGYETECYPYWPHAILLFIFGHYPRRFLALIITKENLKIRQKAYEEMKKTS